MREILREGMRSSRRVIFQRHSNGGINSDGDMALTSIISTGGCRESKCVVSASSWRSNRRRQAAPNIIDERQHQKPAASRGDVWADGGAVCGNHRRRL